MLPHAVLSSFRRCFPFVANSTFELIGMLFTDMQSPLANSHENCSAKHAQEVFWSRSYYFFRFELFLNYLANRLQSLFFYCPSLLDFGLSLADFRFEDDKPVWFIFNNNCNRRLRFLFDITAFWFV